MSSDSNLADRPEHWQVASTRSLLDGDFVSVRRDTIVAPDGSSFDRDVVVHYHPLDASIVYVRLPSGELAVAECSSRTSRKGLTFDDVRRRGSLERAPARDPRVVQKRDESHNRTMELLKASQEKTAAARENPPEQPKEQEFIPASHTPSPRIAKPLPVRLN